MTEIIAADEDYCGCLKPECSLCYGARAECRYCDKLASECNGSCVKPALPYPPVVTAEHPQWEAYKADLLEFWGPDTSHTVDPNDLDRLDDFAHWLRNRGL